MILGLWFYCMAVCFTHSSQSLKVVFNISPNISGIDRILRDKKGSPSPPKVVREGSPRLTPLAGSDEERNARVTEVEGLDLPEG